MSANWNAESGQGLARPPGIRTVQHEYFYAVNMADDQTRQRYLDRAYLLGKEFTGASARAGAA